MTTKRVQCKNAQGVRTCTLSCVIERLRSITQGFVGCLAARDAVLAFHRPRHMADTNF